MPKPDKKIIPCVAGAALGAALGYLTAQLIWAQRYLARQDVRRSLASPPNQFATGLTFSATQPEAAYQVTHSIENGIERITYTPAIRRFETPLLFQHGMWHSAWCWERWQTLFAEWGWESVSYSLPGHGKSPEQRPIRLCTLDYYLAFLKAEVARLPRQPVLIGHSMGGALTQWYLRHVGDDLPAAVLAAPWPHKFQAIDDACRLWRNDPLGFLHIFIDWSASGFMRSPESAARLLTSPQAVISPSELHAHLGPESILVLLQHLSWKAPDKVNTPLLIIAGQEDALFPFKRPLTSAMHYQADFYLAKGAGHNVQMEHNYAETARHIHHWLINEGVT